MTDSSSDNHQLPPQVPSVLRDAEPSESQGSQQASKVIAACDACRKRKTKCSGHRPVCKSCLHRNVPCQYQTNLLETRPQAIKRKYTEIQYQLSPYEELFELLRNLPPDNAAQVLTKIRAGTDITSILSHIKSGNILLQMALAPETRLRYDFPYIREIPEHLLPDNPYLSSLIYKTTSLYPNTSNNYYSHRQQSDGAALSLSKDHEQSDYKRVYLKPFHAAEVIDTRLTSVKPSSWTTVSSNDALMRDLLGTFFRCEYLFQVPFQKDYFLEDMGVRDGSYCTPLLVNAVLSYACLCYPNFQDRAEYWNSKSLSYLFFAEARRLWEIEASILRLPTIQAGVIISIVYATCGLDTIGRPYALHALKLAQQLQLFGVYSDVYSQRDKNARGYTAWMLYAFETIIAVNFFTYPLITQAPLTPLPHPSQDPHWYGEIWLKYPLIPTLSPTYLGISLFERFKFRVIQNQFCQAVFKNKSTKLTLDQANTFYSRLQDWFHSLPSPLTPTFIIYPGHFQIHIHYQNMLMALYEPFLTTPMPIDQSPSPSEVCTRAWKELQTLIRIYYLRHGFAASNFSLFRPLIHLGFYCLKELESKQSGSRLEATRSTLFLTALGLRDLSRSCYMAGTLYVILKDRMREEERKLLELSLGPFQGHEPGDPSTIRTIRSEWPISPSNFGNDEHGDVSKLAEKFAALKDIGKPGSQPVALSESSKKLSINNLID